MTGRSLALVEIDGVGPRVGVLHELEVVRGHSERVEHHVAQLLQVAEHLGIEFGRHGRCFGRRRLCRSRLATGNGGRKLC